MWSEMSSVRHHGSLLDGPLVFCDFFFFPAWGCETAWQAMVSGDTNHPGVNYQDEKLSPWNASWNVWFNLQVSTLPGYAFSHTTPWWLFGFSQVQNQTLCGIRKLSVVQEFLVWNRADVCIFCTITDLPSVTTAQPRGCSMSVQHCGPQSAPRGNRWLGGVKGTLDPAPACTVTSSLNVEKESVQLLSCVFLLYLFLTLSAVYVCLSHPLECTGGLREECGVYTGQEQDVSSNGVFCREGWSVWGTKPGSGKWMCSQF